MPWLWFVAPLLAGLIFVLTGQPDKRALVEIEAFQRALVKRRRLAPAKEPEAPKQPGNKDKTAYRELAEVPKDKPKKKPLKKAKKDVAPKKLLALPPAMTRLMELVGGGRHVASYELLPKVAYATFVTGDLAGGSDHQTIVVELADKAPSFAARPRPVLDGAPVPDTGIQFSKDPEFGAAYIVEGNTAQAKVIGKWLTKTLRETLLDTPEVWLRAEGKLLTITIYGSIRADKIEKLLEVADVFVAEHGAMGGPSLFMEEEELRAPKAVEAEDDEDEDEDEEGDEEDEEEEEEEAQAKAGA